MVGKWNAATGGILDALLSCHRYDEILRPGATQSCHLNGSGLDRQIQHSAAEWRLRSEQQAVRCGFARNSGTSVPSRLQKFLKLCCRVDTLMEKQVRLPADIHGIKECPKFDVRYVAQFVRSCGFEKLDGLGGVFAVDFNGCSNGWQPIAADDAIQWELLLHLVCQSLCSCGIAGACKNQSRQNLHVPG
jgi:hypothetical protein